jgi:hypothetical protein
MKTKRFARALALLAGSALLWALPATGAQARYQHGPDRDPGQEQGSQSPQRDPGSTQASSDSSPGNSQNCFRWYDGKCDQARRERNSHQGDQPPY